MQRMTMANVLSALCVGANWVLLASHPAQAQEDWPVSFLDIEWSIPESDVTTAQYASYEAEVFGIMCRGCPGAPMFTIGWELKDEFPGAIAPLVMPSDRGAEATYLRYCQTDYAGGTCASASGQLFGRAMIDITATRPQDPSLEWSPTDYRQITVDFDDVRLTLQVSSLSEGSTMRWTTHLIDLMTPHFTNE